MSKDKFILSAIAGIFITIFIYFSFFLIPLNSNVSKLKRESAHNIKQYKISSGQLENFNIKDLNNRLDKVNKKISSFSQYKVNTSDVPKLLNDIANIVSRPDVSLELLGIKQGSVRINKKSISFKNMISKRGSSNKTSNNAKSSAPVPPPPPSGSRNAPAPPPPPSSTSPSRVKTLSTSFSDENQTEKVISWKELPIYIELSGEFVDISKFFFFLNKMDKIIIADSISLEADKMNTGKVYCKVNLIVLMGEIDEKS